jgi:hypothetical protein
MWMPAATGYINSDHVSGVKMRSCYSQWELRAQMSGTHGRSEEVKLVSGTEDEIKRAYMKFVLGIRDKLQIIFWK